MSQCYLLGTLFVLVSLLRRSESHIVPFDEQSCPLRLGRNFSQNQLLAQLTSPCRYNKKHTPIDPNECAPLKVKARIHVYHLRSGSETNAEFKVQLLLQLHWRDPRLAYRGHAPHITELVGERNFIKSIWTPHIYLTNERDSLVLGLFRRDMLVSILPDGDMLFSTRLKTTIFCWVQLGKFPFDQQKCHLIMDSWRYNASELMLEWDPHPVTIPASRPYLTEYHLMDTVTQVQDQFAEPTAVSDADHSYKYSSLTLTFILDRQYGFYLMDFYAPSILLVCTSWVSFWMAPDAVPGRTILGASTMLTFFQLGIETGTSLPNVSYIRSNDVWFFACTVFIFLSLAEFAFVNTIWRYGDQKVKLKKATSKYILKSSVHPHLQYQRELGRKLSVTSHLEPLEWISRADADSERMSRVDANLEDRVGRRKSLSCQTTPEMKKSLAKINMKDLDHKKSISTLDLAYPLRELNVPSLQGEQGRTRCFKVPTLQIDDEDNTPCFNLPTLEIEHDDPNGMSLDCTEDHKDPPISMRHHTDIPFSKPISKDEHSPPKYSTLMSMQDIAIWVDNKSKIVFPLAFTLFNATYWGILLSELKLYQN